VPSYPQCNCTADWMRSPPFGCFAGDDGGAWSNVTITPLADLCGSRECMSCVMSDVGVKGGWGGGGLLADSKCAAAAAAAAQFG
jgi:hypothetical protein